MDDSFEEPMDISDSDDEEFDKDATYKVLSIDEITHKMEQIIEGVVSSTEVIEPILFVFCVCQESKIKLLFQFLKC